LGNLAQIRYNDRIGDYHDYFFRRRVIAVPPYEHSYYAAYFHIPFSACSDNEPYGSHAYCFTHTYGGSRAY
jgi:hypothetical protein